MTQKSDYGPTHRNDYNKRIQKTHWQSKRVPGKNLQKTRYPLQESSTIIFYQVMTTQETLSTRKAPRNIVAKFFLMGWSSKHHDWHVPNS